MCVFVCVCVSVCLYMRAKINSKFFKFKIGYIVVHENKSKSDIEHCRIKVKVMIGFFSPFAAIQIVRSYDSTLVQVRKLILGRGGSRIFE